MREFRVSIAGLMGFVILCGIALDALVHPTWFRACGVTTLALGILAFAIVGAILGRARAFWLGFTIFGWVYVAVEFSSWLNFSDLLLTSAVLEELYPRLHPKEAKTPSDLAVIPANIPMPPDAPLSPDPFMPSVALPGPTNGTGFFRQAPTFVYSYEYIAFRQIGQGLASLLAGLVGGVVASFCDARRRGFVDLGSRKSPVA